MNDVHALHCAHYAGDIPDVAFHELDLMRSRCVFPQVEDAHALAARMQPARNEVAEKARPAGDEVFHA
jgi:hypothetical protein